MTMAMLDRPLAITDYETTGTDPDIHEIIEVGLLVVDQHSLEVITGLNLRVMPEHPETATEYALKVNGYNEADWRGAIDLGTAMRTFMSMAKDAMCASHNISFEQRFTAAALKKTGVRDTMDYHRPDLFTAALESLRHSGLTEFNLVKVAAFLGIEPEPDPHRAINGAKQALDVYRRIRELNRRLWDHEVLTRLLRE